METSSPLNQLRSAAYSELLNAVDKLRTHGFQGELDLPQLIVCGDQSSGKSSVLEAISHVAFPANDGLCTHFASELRLRTGAETRFSVFLMAAAHRSPEEKALIQCFCPSFELRDTSQFPKVVQEATEHLREIEDTAYYQDKLVAEIQSPISPCLTLVDLPGLIHASNAEQTTSDIAVVRDIIESYISDKNSIILAVVSANVNLANNAILEIAKANDEKGTRTLGIITKPDCVDQGSPTESNWINTAGNNNRRLELGWHVLKNRDHAHRYTSASDRDSLEEQFFNTTNWSIVPEQRRGIQSLRSKLSNILLSAVQRNLPKLVDDIKVRIASCITNLKNLGPTILGGEGEQRRELVRISTKLQQIVHAGVEGHYKNDFFQVPDDDLAAGRRLRAKIRNISDASFSHMQGRGHFYAVDESANPIECRTTVDFSVVPIVLSAKNEPAPAPIHLVLKAVQKLIKENRGCELDGLLSPDVVPQLFKVQSSPWTAITDHYMDRCWEAVYTFFYEALHHVASPHIASLIWELYAEARLADIRSQLAAKVQELLKPYKRGICTVVNSKRMSQAIEDRSRRRVQSAGAGNARPESHGESLALQALNHLEAYYQIAFSTYTETIATLAVENCLLDGLREIFTPEDVATFDANMLRSLTSEPEHVAECRDDNTRRLETLKSIQSIFTRQATGVGHPAAPRTPEIRVSDASISPEYQTPSPEQRISSSVQKHDSPSSRDDVFRAGSKYDPAMPTPPLTPASKGKEPQRDTGATSWTSSRADIPQRPEDVPQQSPSTGIGEKNADRPRRSLPTRRSRNLSTHSDRVSDTSEVFGNPGPVEADT